MKGKRSSGDDDEVRRFDPTERAAWGGFLNFQSRLLRIVEDDLRENDDLTHPEFEVLLRLSLSPDGRMRIQDLAEASILTPSGMSRLVGRLEARSLVERSRALEDGRGAYATLSEEGHRLFAATADRHTQLVRDVFLSKYTKTELRQLGQLFKRFNDGPRT